MKRKNISNELDTIYTTYLCQYCGTNISTKAILRRCLGNLHGKISIYTCVWNVKKGVIDWINCEDTLKHISKWQRPKEYQHMP